MCFIALLASSCAADERPDGGSTKRDGGMSTPECSVCDERHRECAGFEGGAECGACASGFIEEGGDCSPRRSCQDAQCGDVHRSCIDSDAKAHASCGDCLDGFDEVDGACVAGCEDCAARNRECGASGSDTCGDCSDGYVENATGTCIPFKSCDGACGTHQVCVEDPTARCLMQCDGNWIWDGDHCRAEKTCANLACNAGQTCDERSIGEDARCTGASCPEGQGRNKAGACEACAGWRNCTSMTGATGEVFATTQGCRCQPDEGHFINATGAPQSCDTDHDGWVNDQAAGTIEAADARLAQCELRTISTVVLIDDAGEERTVPITPPLPLYEHPTNDGSSSANPHPSYGVAVAPKALNSFTKACVTETGDFNKNGIDDVREHVNAQVTIDNARVVNYFTRYRAFAYFMEISEGWYSAPGVYTIRERPRVTTSFPLRYADGAADKWKTCTRHADSAYLAGGFATQVGRDFSSFSAQAGWGGMNHHSQFKCVRAVQSSSYDPASPEQVYIANGTFQWAGPGTVTATPRNWTRNVCLGLDSYRDSPDASVPNAALQDFSCAASADLAGLEGHVTWVSIGYVNGSQEGGVTASGPEYVRGCINECAEHDSLPKAEQCATVAANPGFGCRADVSTFGALACGCRRNFGGPGCSIACPDSELLTNIDSALFPDVTSGSGSDTSGLRAGFWMCGGFSSSSHPVMSSGGYTLRGEVSATAIDGTVVSGGGYTLRAR